MKLVDVPDTPVRFDDGTLVLSARPRPGAGLALVPERPQAPNG